MSRKKTTQVKDGSSNTVACISKIIRIPGQKSLKTILRIVDNREVPYTALLLYWG